MVSNSISLIASSYGNLFSSGSGVLSVPVNPSAVIYTQFSHIQGIAAASGQEGVPVSKVKILNSLIEQLVSMKNKTVISKEDASKLDDNQMENLIKQYQKQIQTSLAENAKGNTYGLAGIRPEAGNLINILA